MESVPIYATDVHSQPSQLHKDLSVGTAVLDDPSLGIPELQYSDPVLQDREDFKHTLIKNKLTDVSSFSKVCKTKSPDCQEVWSVRLKVVCISRLSVSHTPNNATNETKLSKMSQTCTGPGFSQNYGELVPTSSLTSLLQNGSLKAILRYYLIDQLKC